MILYSVLRTSTKRWLVITSRDRGQSWEPNVYDYKGMTLIVRSRPPTYTSIEAARQAARLLEELNRLKP